MKRLCLIIMLNTVSLFSTNINTLGEVYATDISNKSTFDNKVRYAFFLGNAIKGIGRGISRGIGSISRGSSSSISRGSSSISRGSSGVSRGSSGISRGNSGVSRGSSGSNKNSTSTYGKKELEDTYSLLKELDYNQLLENHSSGINGYGMSAFNPELPNIKTINKGGLSSKNATLSIALANKSIWRGIPQTDEKNIQIGAHLVLDKFYIGGLHTRHIDNKLNETTKKNTECQNKNNLLTSCNLYYSPTSNLYLGFTKKISNSLLVNIGAITYLYNEKSSQNNKEDWEEMFLGLSYENVSVNVSHSNKLFGIEDLKGTYYSLGLDFTSNTYIGLGFGAKVGYYNLNSKNLNNPLVANDYKDFQVGMSLSLPKLVNLNINYHSIDKNGKLLFNTAEENKDNIVISLSKYF